MDDMVAAGSEDGTITIFQLPRVTLDTTSSLSKHQLLSCCTMFFGVLEINDYRFFCQSIS